jgi:hypothetical protein
MINKMCKTGGFKLPHMSKSPVAYHEKGHMVKAEKVKIKNPKTTQEEQLKAAKETLKQISQKPLLEPKPLKPEMRGPINYGHDKVNPFAPEEKVPSFQETFTSSSGGGLTDDERAEANRLLDSVKGTYMDRKFKRKGRYDQDLRKVVFDNVPLSDEDNEREYNMEKGEYYVDFDKDGKASVQSVPRGDDDIPVQSFLKGLDPSQYRGELFTDLPEDYQDPGLIKGHPLNPNEGYQRVKNYRNR